MKVFFTVALLLLLLAVKAQPPFMVFFDFNRYGLTEKARNQLDSFLLAERPNLETHLVQLHGHCDAIGSDGYNHTLSAKRINTVRKYLAEHGGVKQFTNIKAHGERLPLNNNSTEEERQMNRRVEISIVKVNSPGGPESSLKEKIADTATIVGTNIVLRNINFVGGMHEFLPSSTQSLQELLDAMNAYPGLEIRVEGHICCEPGTEDGTDLGTGLRNLSVARAKAVQDYLIQNGIDPARISYKGFGHSTPLYPYPERSEEERIANRRVEIKILKK